MDWGVVSPGLSGATTTTGHHGGGAAPAHCLLADRVGGVAKGREHTASVVLALHSGASRAQREACHHRRRVVAVRRDLDI